MKAIEKEGNWGTKAVRTRGEKKVNTANGAESTGKKGKSLKERRQKIVQTEV